ncbi:unnamed protein product [Ceratitis capitata]|uniref:(Mediterranean fruit fly) hypothetical protein n=1 Tax=Ceratitis capitata TaxID=7213 RepID=A0A811V3P4_CERCA|nr:unnamed protein product [Ceratitis capitata]
MFSFNVCQCTKDFRGDNCQYSIQACNVSQSGFNGSYKCRYDLLEAKCKFSCATVPGIKVQGNLDIEYGCKYNVGQFYPQPLPKCIIVTYIATVGVVGSFERYGVKWSTESERIQAIFDTFTNVRSEWWSSEEVSVPSTIYNLYTEGDVDVMIDRTPKNALCTTWGGINMKPSMAPLSCSHTLINDKVDATFDVTLKACPYGSGYGCAHSLTIYWQEIPYILDNTNGTVSIHAD